ncbi:MAG: DsrE/DsrF/DrsH-like family protein [Anaerolineae bacterium]|nr:DsrE/DsrF/DrsH-like family protein [Anaerolineae bacterium]MDW8069214.1 DsrE/DsrF/DrsH-like family protein [Anaerolineae bacterium]
MNEHEARKASIVVFSGDMDKVMAAFIIATTAAASGIQTTMFFTFWGLQAIKKRVSTGQTVFQKMLSLFFKDIDRIGPSRLNMGGLGRWMFKRMMKQQNVATLPELRRMAIDLGVKLLACQMSMEVMGIRREDLIDEVSDVVGAATYIAEANQSHITLFI